MREWWRRTYTRQLTRLRTDGRAGLLWSLRITVGSVASYVVATVFFPGTQPLLAPLTAMLVIQVTPVSLLASGVDRVASVVVGVLVAVGFADVVPLTWWSLGLLIIVALTIGQVLRLRANQLEVAISGMLVLGASSLDAEAAAWQRVGETLVGAAVGIVVNLAFPPKVASADAGRALDGLANRLTDLLGHAADELAELVAERRDIAPAARRWLEEARHITHDMPQVGAALLKAEQGRRLNVRAVGTPDAGPGLRQGMESLEHAAVAIRVMFRSVLDGILDATWLDDESGEDVLLGLAHTFRELAAGVDAFGELVRDDANRSSTMESSDVQRLRDALDGLHEARARLEDLMLSGPPRQLLELHAAVLATVKRLLQEMDLDERVRRQVRLLRRSRHRTPRVSFSHASPLTGYAETTPEAETQVLPLPPREDGPSPGAS